MMYPLYLLSSKHVAKMVDLGAVKCSHLAWIEADKETGRNKKVNWTDIIHFYREDGTEIGYCNTFGTEPTTFDPPRKWGQEHIDAQCFYDMRRPT